MSSGSETPTCPRPDIDYVTLPYLPREGIQADGNYKYATRSLFLETAPTKEAEMKALWCLSEHEVFANGKWYPSAWMAYLHATDEYDALRKICGNVKQWEAILRMRYNEYPLGHDKGLISMWRLEHAYMARSRLRATLTNAALALTPGYASAAKLLLGMIEGPAKRGRPPEAKPEADKAKEVAADAARIVSFRS